MSKRKNIGVLIGRAQTYFPKEIIEGIRQTAKENEVNSYMFLGIQPSDFLRAITGNNTDIVTYDYQANSIYEYAHLGGFDGTIINFGTVGYYLGNQTRVDDFARPFINRPVIVLTDICSLPGVSSIIYDNKDGVKKLVDGLIEKGGYTKILFISGPVNNTDSDERMAGYLESMASHGLSVSEDMIVAGDFSEFVDDQINYLLDRNPDAQALVFANDEMAFCGYKICQERGLRVGEDIAITGFDNCIQSVNVRPKLTSINQNGKILGHFSVCEMMRILNGEQSDAVYRIPAETVWRESSGQQCAEMMIESVAKTEEVDSKYIRLRQKHIHFQRNSWTMTLLSRQLSDYIDDEKLLCEKMLENLCYYQVDNSYLFLLEKTIYNDGITAIEPPEDLYLAAFCRNGVTTVYETHERPLVSENNTISQITDDGEQHNFFVFLLYAGTRQYGILMCETSKKDFSFLYAASLQFGQVLQAMELRQLALASLRNLTRDMEDIKERNRVLDLMSEYDELTGLLNLRGFKEHIKRMNLEQEVTAYIAYCDLDHLKEINDTWGHIEGNYAIRAVGQLLKSCLFEGDLLARIGGDEFVCLIFSQTGQFDVLFRQRVHSACRNLNATSGKPYYIEVSVGIHRCFLEADTQLADMLRLADQSLYEDKKGRRRSIKKEMNANGELLPPFVKMDKSSHTVSFTRDYRRKILIVEDNELNREMLKEILLKDFDVLEAENGEEAYRILEKMYKDISLILLDLVMPVCDGYQFLERVKDDLLLARVPVVAVSGNTEFENRSRCFSLGAIDVMSKPYEPEIIVHRVRNLIRMKEMTTSMTMIEVDELTGLYTKEAFYHYARALVDANPDQNFNIIVNDIQHFKMINSLYGEKKGDELIKSFATFVSNVLPNGICGRYGGDQIIAIIKTPEGDQEKLLTEKLDIFMQISPISNITIKSGIYERIDRRLPMSRICDRADMALKSIKTKLDSKVSFYNGPVSQRDLKRKLFESRFQGALDHREFVVWFQPQYDIHTEEIIGAESLVRWKTEGRVATPNEFLPIFEEDGLISLLDEYVFSTVCSFQKHRKETGQKIIPISVNLSRYCMQNSNVVERYLDILQEYELEPHMIPIEITESSAISIQKLMPVADDFSKNRFILHMDDFGAGSSSLNGLKLLPYESIKLDKSLIDFIGENRGNTLLKYAMALIKELGMTIIAEGVENAEQIEFLKENGCNIIQGYYYSKPLPVEEFEKLLSQ